MSDYFHDHERDSLPRSRAAALQNDSRYYYTGKLCKRGHRAARLTSNGTCLGCTKSEFRLDSKTAMVLQRHLEPLRTRIAQLELQVYNLNKKLHACGIC